MPEFYEFFAGGGMARAGLGPSWRCLFANDFDHKKSNIYRRYWGHDTLKTVDVQTISPKDLPGEADLVWGYFPCQDLSLAGGADGLKGDRSGAFWPFWILMNDLISEGRAPQIIALENVCGTLTSHGGKDFAAICSTFEEAGYRFGALVIDAAHFVPQSRPRLFIVGVRNDVALPACLTRNDPSPLWHPRGLLVAHAKTPSHAQKELGLVDASLPSSAQQHICGHYQENPTDVEWHSAEKFAHFSR